MYTCFVSSQLLQKYFNKSAPPICGCVVPTTVSSYQKRKCNELIKTKLILLLKVNQLIKGFLCAWVWTWQWVLGSGSAVHDGHICRLWCVLGNGACWQNPIEANVITYFGRWEFSWKNATGRGPWKGNRSKCCQYKWLQIFPACSLGCDWSSFEGEKL